MLPLNSKAFRCALLVSAALYAAPAAAQETAGQINGYIAGADGRPLANAEVVIIHEPTGTAQSVTTNEQGRFISRGLRLGGPYVVTINGTEQVQEQVFLNLGQAYDLDYQMGRAAVEELVVTGRRLVERAPGPTSEFDRERIANAPSVSRDLKDVLRADSKVYIDRTNQDAIQVAGTNNRFNLLTIDGIRNNDDFGLNNGGYPGLRAPVSIDVIDQLAVNIAPYAVTYSGFQGGNINIVTKSGTNEYNGSVYGYYSDQSLLGNNSGARPVTGLVFKDKTYGGTFGGPIVKDKLFFFVGYEKFKTGNPITTGPAGAGFANEITEITQAQYDQIASIAQSVYGYDILDFDSTLPETDEKIFAKLNWNVNDDHRLQVSYNRDKGNVVVSPGPVATISSVRSLGSGSNWYNNTQKVDSVSGQLFSDWSDAFKSELKVGYKKVAASPIPRGVVPFAEMQVRTPAGGMLAFGPDRFRHFNALNNELWTFKLKGDYLLGDHTITAGVERDELDVFNAFFQDAYGTYYFNSIADLQSRTAARLDFNGAVSGDVNDVAATFDSNTTSFYAQDLWEATPELSVLFGLRRESYSSKARPILNTRFQQRYGFDNTETFDGRGLWLPRLSFTYDLSEATLLRGGVGLFGGGTPNVWLSNSYSNTGVAGSNIVVTRPAAGVALTPLQAAALNNVSGSSIPAAVQGALVAGDGVVNAVDPDFKIPSVWKASIGVDQTLDFGRFGSDYQIRADIIYSKVKQAQNWIDLRRVQTGTAPDGRPIYALRTVNPALPASTAVDMLLTNSDGGRGWVASVQLAKEWDTGNYGRFNVELGYTWQDITEVNPGTSSVAQSNWDNVAVSDMNNPSVSTSNYEIKHNGVLATNWTKAFWGDYETSVGFFGIARSGRPFSYTFAGNSAVFGDPRQGARQRQLFYVPKDATDVNLAGGLTYAQLDAYIVENGLDKYRGQIVPRNAFRSPSVASVDMRFTQEIPGLFEDSKGVFSMDIRNLTNMINSSWGRDIQIGFPFVVPVVEATSVAGGKYTYSGPLRTKNRTLTARTSVWQIQFGARYEF